MEKNHQIIIQAINTIRFLSADAIQNANSGHPGLPMGTAAIAYTIWMNHLRYNPENPSWADRDRFILSGGHGSMLLYSLLHLTGYDLALEDIIRFRQLGSITPGHPEYGLTPGIEVTTGPLGQGFANGIGMAIVESHLSSLFNTQEFDIINHYVYAIVTDGDLMEGVASEAASLAGHLRLGKLIYLYDDNHISIDGSTDLTFTENRADRFESYGWHVIRGIDGLDTEEINQAIIKAKSDPRPSLIICKTCIGYGLPTRQGTAKAHGEPPGQIELDAAKDNLGWPKEPRFYVPDSVRKHFLRKKEEGIELENSWNEKLELYKSKYPERAMELLRRLANKLPDNWTAELAEFPENSKGIATRVSSGLVLNQLAKTIPELIGGSADLAPSNKTWIDGYPSFQADQHEGRNFHFGVREHAMGAIVNGMSVHGGVIPFGATFLVFSDYMRPAIRLSALSDYPSIWIFTHDSIGLGEDGPTHQPIEHLASLRAIPNLVVIRPADANEVVHAWKIAIEKRHSPTALILSRQNLPTLDRNYYAAADNLMNGAYVLKDVGGKDPEIILLASGSEVPLIIDAANILVEKGKKVRLVSFPSWELFKNATEEYRELTLPKTIRLRVAVEAGISQGWEKWVGDHGKIISLDTFGASAPYEDLYSHFGITVDKIVEAALSLF